MKREYKGNIKPWQHALGMLSIVASALLLFLTSCSPKIVERIVYQRDTTEVVKIDSVWQYQHDSVFVKEKGDTVYKYVEHIRYRDRIKIDTLVKVKVDSVTVETIREVQVEQPLTWWQKFRQGAFWWLVIGILILLLWTFRKMLFKLFAG